jgi:hypothetical protein
VYNRNVATCERCGSTEGVELEDSRTMYEPKVYSRYELLMLLDDPLVDEPEDPNRPWLLCRECAKEHHEYWDEMWDMYRSNQGI